MKKQLNLEFIDESNENNYNSDLYNEIYEQQPNVRNPKIPDSLRTPEPSQKKLFQINKKLSKLDNESQIDLNSDINIYSSRNSNILGSSLNNFDKIDGQLNKSKLHRTTKYRSGYLSNNNSNKIITKSMRWNKSYSYRRPFSKNKRKFIFLLICLINILVNLDRGAIPAATTEIKEKIKISNAQLGMIGSLLFLGLILGSLTGGYIFSKYSSKWIVILSLFVFCFFLYSFTILESYGGMYLCRVGCGFCEVFCLIYFPIWVDQYGVKGMKTMWLTFLQMGVPLGWIIGFLIEVGSIKYYKSWEGGFFMQIILVCVCNGILFLTPDKFFERNYKHSESTQEEIENEFKMFKEVYSKKLTKNHNQYLLNNMNLINDVYNSKYGRPSLYSIFSMVEFEEEYGTEKYCDALKQLSKNKSYITTMLGISCSLFVITGMQFWMSDYMQEVLHLKQSETYLIYIIVCISAPTFGVLTGGFLIQYLGGYTTEKALDAICKLTFIAFICTCFLPLIDITIIFALFVWLLLFFESSVTPGLTGLMITSISGSYKEFGNSITQLCYNLIGFLPSPYIYGLVCSISGREDSKWGLSVMILWSLFGFISIYFAKKIIINNKMEGSESEINKKDYLEKMIDPKKSESNEIFNSMEYDNENTDYKKRQTIDSNFSTEDIKELDNKKQDITNNRYTRNVPSILTKSIGQLKQKSNLITNIFGGINQV